MWNPGRRERTTAGKMKNSRRVAEAVNGGQVLPIPWNALEGVKISPIAAELNEMMCRYSLPTAITPGSFVKARMKIPASICEKIVSKIMIAVVIHAAE